MVPVARSVMLSGDLFEDAPREHIRPIETCQTQLARARVKAVMPVGTIRSENQSGRACLIVELHRDGDFVRSVRHCLLREAKRTAAETRARSLHLDAASFRAPTATEERCPVL